MSESTHDIESEMNATNSNMSFSLFLESSFDTSPTNEPTNPTSHDNAAHPFDRQQDFDDFINPDLMEAHEEHLDCLPHPDVESYSSLFPEDDDNDEGTTEGNDLDDCVLNDDDKDNNSASASSSQQVENDMASLEGYLDDMLYEEDTPGHHYGGNVNAEGELDDELPPSYVEGSDVKELLQSLMDEQIPPCYKSQIDKLHPTEEELIIIMRKNHLPIKLYKVLLDWAHRASKSNYEFDSPTYKTALDRMKKKYLIEAGTAPLRSTIEVEGDTFPPMHVYRFSILHHVKRLFRKKEMLEGVMWRFEARCCPETNERGYDKLNSGEWWEGAEREMEHQLDLLGTAKPQGLHFILPIILFDDSTLCDNIGRLLAQPILCTLGNLSDELRRLAEA
jgi:hypothetical protein